MDMWYFARICVHARSWREFAKCCFAHFPSFFSVHVDTYVMPTSDISRHRKPCNWWHINRLVRNIVIRLTTAESMCHHLSLLRGLLYHVRLAWSASFSTWSLLLENMHVNVALTETCFLLSFAYPFAEVAALTVFHTIADLLLFVPFSRHLPPPPPPIQSSTSFSQYLFGLPRFLWPFDFTSSTCVQA